MPETSPGYLRECFAALAAGLIFLDAIVLLIEVGVPLALFGPVVFADKWLPRITSLWIILKLTVEYLIVYGVIWVLIPQYRLKWRG